MTPNTDTFYTVYKSVQMKILETTTTINRMEDQANVREDVTKSYMVLPKHTYSFHSWLMGK